MINQRIPVKDVDINLDRDLFLRDLLRQLSGMMEDVIGIKESSGFVSVVGQRIGEQIDSSYKEALDLSQLDRSQVGEVLVDLKKRIQGDFYIIEEDDEKIVLGNRACPFGERVRGRESLCMMTSNVFGFIAAENLGYARVNIEKAIARGDSGCRVVVHLQPDAERTDTDTEGREYFRAR